MRVDHHLLGLVGGDYPVSPAPHLGGLVKVLGNDLVVMTCKSDGLVGVSFELAEAAPAPKASDVSVAFDWTPQFDALWLRGGVDSAERAVTPQGWLAGTTYRTLLLGYGRDHWDVSREDDAERYQFILFASNAPRAAEVIRQDRWSASL